jgi:hypothetical protein
VSRERCVNKGRIPCRHVRENVPIKAFQIGIGTARSEFYAAKAEFAKVDSMFGVCKRVLLGKIRLFQYMFTFQPCCWWKPL